MSNSYSSFFSSFSRILQNFNQHFVTFDISILITVLACDELFCWVGSYRGLGGGVRNVTKQTGWQVSSLITYRVFKQTVTSVPIDHTAQTLNTETWAVLCHPHPAAVQCHQTGRTIAGTPCSTLTLRIQHIVWFSLSHSPSFIFVVFASDETLDSCFYVLLSMECKCCFMQCAMNAM